MNFKEAYDDTCSTVSKAARLGEVDALKHLIQIGKPIDVKDNRGWQSIHEAAYNGHVDCLNIIIIEGAEVDCRSFEEETALMLACAGGHPECVECLLDAGADPNATTNEKFTPLSKAAVVNIECVKMLIKAGARVNHCIYTGDTALHEVINQQEHADIDVIRYLVEHGSDISVQNECGLTPLFLAAQFGLTQCLQYFIECAQQKGEEFKRNLMNKTAYDNASPLYLATQEEHIDCVRLLVENGADPNIRMELTDGLSPIYVVPLQVALEKGNVECVKLLLKVTDLEQFRIAFKSNMDCINYNPLVYAMEHSSEECLQILLKQKFFKNFYTETFSNCLNPFTFNIKIRPAIVFVKSFPELVKDWLVQCDLNVTSIVEDYSFFLLCLKFGYRKSHVLFEVLKNQALALKYWCAMLKYFQQDCLCWDYENKCASRKPCINASCNPVWTPTSDVILKQLQLYLSRPVVNKQQHGGSQCLQLRQMYTDTYGTDLVDTKEINSLQNMCRQSVVLRLIACNHYKKEVIQSQLHLPQLLQLYLMYDRHEFGEKLLSACRYLVDREETLDKLMEEVSVN